MFFLKGKIRTKRIIKYSMAKRLSCMIYGEVQGVFYRRFIKESAEKLGLVGSVRNLSDGTVEVIAEGDEAVLNEFLTALRGGHRFAKVTQIHDVWSDPTNMFSDFRIITS